MKPFHIKYRPKKWEEVVGQNAIVESIRSEIPNQKFYLLYGMHGTGKTTVAHIIANAVGCKGNGLVEINASSHNKVEDARAIENDCIYFPFEGDVVVYIFDEAHRLTPDAQNVLLTVLEEPPEHVYFIFCSTEPNKLLKTVRSRAAEYEFKPVSPRDISVILDKVLNEENIKLKQKAYKWIVENSEGIPRDALVLLDQIKDLKDLDKIKEIVLLSSESEVAVRELCRLVYKRNNWEGVTKILNTLNEDPERIRRAILGYLSKVVLNSEQPSFFVVEMMEYFLKPFYDSGKPGLVHAIAKVYNSSPNSSVRQFPQKQKILKE